MTSLSLASQNTKHSIGRYRFVELPEEGQTLSKDDEAAVIESVKAASDILCPIDGEVIEVNQAIVDEPTKVNEDPLGTGWFFKIVPSDLSQMDDYMDENAYNKLIHKRLHLSQAIIYEPKREKCHLRPPTTLYDFANRRHIGLRQGNDRNAQCIGLCLYR